MTVIVSSGAELTAILITLATNLLDEIHYVFAHSELLPVAWTSGLLRGDSGLADYGLWGSKPWEQIAAAEGTVVSLIQMYSVRMLR